MSLYSAWRARARLSLARCQPAFCLPDHVRCRSVSCALGRCDCASAGGHWDPTGLEGAAYTCSSRTPSTCFAGDLSGKLGMISIGDSEHHISMAMSCKLMHKQSASCL